MFVYCYHRIIVWIDCNRCKWLKAIRIRTSHIIIVQMFLSRDKRQMTSIVCFCIIESKKKSMQCKCIRNRHNRIIHKHRKIYDRHTNLWWNSQNKLAHVIRFFCLFVSFIFAHADYTAVKWICLFVGCFIVHSGSELTAGFINCIFIS